MGTRDNDWYVAELASRALTRSIVPRGWTIGLTLLLLVPLWFAFQSGALDALARIPAAPAFVPIFAGALFVLALLGGRIAGRVLQSRNRAAYLAALAAPSVEPLLAVVDRTSRMVRRLPDGDALAAQARALAFALYGQDPEAFRALGDVSWGARAPLIRAIGVSTEALIEAICRRDATRALELARRAQGLAELSARVPGAEQTARYHATCVGAAEALSGTPSPASIAALETTAANPAYPASQLIAAFALAVAAERAGDGERARRLRAFIRQTAPHCPPLHASAEAFSSAPTQPGPTSGVASPAPVSGSPDAPPGTPARRFRRAFLVRVGSVVGLWVALLLLFFVLFRLFGAQ